MIFYNQGCVNHRNNIQGITGPQVFTCGPKIDFIDKNRCTHSLIFYISWPNIPKQMLTNIVFGNFFIIEFGLVGGNQIPKSELI